MIYTCTINSNESFNITLKEGYSVLYIQSFCGFSIPFADNYGHKTWLFAFPACFKRNISPRTTPTVASSSIKVNIDLIIEFHVSGHLV